MLGGGGKPSYFASMQSVDGRKVAQIEDRLVQMEDKLNTFMLKSQGTSLAGKAQTTLGKGDSAVSLRALEHQLTDKIAQETASLQRHFD